MDIASTLTDVIEHSDHLELVTDGPRFLIYALDPRTIRFRASFDPEFVPELSYTLVRTAWPDAADEVLGEERTHVEALHLTPNDEDGAVTFSTGEYTVTVAKHPFAISIADSEGRIVHRDLAGRSWLADNNGRLSHYSALSQDDLFYGFGEKVGPLNKARRRMRMHNLDTMGWNPLATDPLYKHVPFYIHVDPRQGLAHGMFYNNSYDSVFDVDCEHSNYWEHYSYYQTDGGDLDLFFIGGPTVRDVVAGYTALTGTSALQPLASLGYMGSTMYYTELEAGSDQAILDFVDLCAEHQIPCDGFFASSGYTSSPDNKRYVFTWNTTRFPDPKGFVQALSDKGVLLAPNIKPGMLTTHPLTGEFDEAGGFVKDPSGEHSQIDQFWGGPAHFVDFTDPAGREVWSRHMTSSLIDLGVTSIWNDNNEFEIADDAALVHAEGLKLPIGAVRPVMANLMSKVSHDAVIAHDPNTRPYIISRSGFAGIQRYAQTWAGDNFTSWDSLRHNVTTVLGLGLSGLANTGCDVGGFAGPAPEPELFVRWVQNGIFFPRFSIHSCNDDNTVTEPWMYPSVTQEISAAIRLRYTLVPYLYSLLREAHVSGAPVMRPLVYEFEDDPRAREESFEFMLGSSLLVSSVLTQGETEHTVYLPAGAAWLDLATRTTYEGGQEITIPVELGSIPMFLRSGGIVATCPGLMNLHRQRIEHLDLLLEPSETASFVHYEDDGATNEYLDGHFHTTTYAIRPEAGRVVLDVANGGLDASKVETMTLDIACRTHCPVTITVAGREIERNLHGERLGAEDEGWYFDGEKNRAIVQYRTPREDHQVVVDFGVKDLLGL